MYLVTCNYHTSKHWFVQVNNKHWFISSIEIPQRMKLNNVFGLLPCDDPRNECNWLDGGSPNGGAYKTKAHYGLLKLVNISLLALIALYAVSMLLVAYVLLVL